jgi:serine/threonine-protein kinase
MALERRSIGRYVLYDRIASGGMAQVHLGRLVGAVGFARTVAIKRLLPHCATDAEMVPMFVDEARLAARIRHPNVVATLDVVLEDDELLIVMEYVHGESLGRLFGRARTRHESVSPAIASALAIGMLEGLHAAHEARSDHGQPLGIIHRDVSPQNVIAGVDGIARVVDFGIAKARDRIQTTRDGQLKGKAGYIAPEQLEGDAPIDRRVDIYAAGVVLWEALAGRRLFEGDGAPAIMAKIMTQEIVPPSRHAPAVPPALDAIVMRALARSPELRFETARAMAEALERAAPPASPREVEAWVLALAGDVVESRAELVAAIESDSAGDIEQARASAMPSVGRARAKPSDDHATAPLPATASELATAPLTTSPSVTLAVDARREWNVPPKQASAVLVGAALVAMLATAGALLLVTRGRGSAEPDLARSAASNAAARAAAPSGEGVEAAQPGTRAATGAIEEAGAVDAGDSVAAVASGIAAAAAPKAPAPKHVAKPGGATHKSGGVRPGCQVPFTRAPDGTKIPKPECF